MEHDVGQFAVCDLGGDEGGVRLRTSVGGGSGVEQAKASGCDGVPGNVRVAEDQQIAVSETDGAAPFTTSFGPVSCTTDAWRAGNVHCAVSSANPLSGKN